MNTTDFLSERASQGTTLIILMFNCFLDIIYERSIYLYLIISWTSYIRHVTCDLTCDQKATFSGGIVVVNTTLHGLNIVTYPVLKICII